MGQDGNVRAGDRIQSNDFDARRIPRGLQRNLDFRLHIRAARQLRRDRRDLARLRFHHRVDACCDRPGLGRPRAGDPRLDARHGSKPIGGRACGRSFRRAAPPNGRLDAADAEAAGRALVETRDAGALHGGEHLGGGDPAVAHSAPRRAYLVYQRAWHRLHRLRDRGDARWLLPRRQDADADQRRAFVSHAARVPDVDAAQRAHAGRPGRARARPRARPAVRSLADRARSAVERDRWRDGCVCGASCARGAAMTALSGELGAYLALILVGFLPNEVWRWLAVIFSRGLDEDAEILIWVRAVATAILAGVIAKLTIFSPGVLATVPTPLRLGAVLVGVIGFSLVRRSVFVGVLAGEAALILGALLFAP